METLYRGYRIALKQNDKWIARITHVRGTLVPLNASASLAEGAEACTARARELIDRYIAFLSNNDIDGRPN